MTDLTLEHAEILLQLVENELSSLAAAADNLSNRSVAKRAKLQLIRIKLNQTISILKFPVYDRNTTTK